MTSSMTRRKAMKTLGAAAGALAAGAVLPVANAAPAPGEVRVLALNTWLSGSKISNGIELIADLIIATKTSIALLSEAGKATEPVAAALARKGYQFHAAPSSDTGVLSVYPIEERALLPGMVKARVNVDGKKLAVYSAHLEYRWYATYLPRGYAAGVPSGEYSGWGKLPGGPVTDTAILHRVNRESGRPDAIGKFIEDAKAEAAQGSSVILGGDFNEPSALDWTSATGNMFEHNGVAIAWESTQRLQQAGFVDAYRSKYPNPVTHPGITFPADNPDAKISDLDWTPEADGRDRIDYIFAGPSLSLSEVGMVGPRGTIVRGKRVPDDTQDNYISSPSPWVTDHKAVFATYRLTGGGPITGSASGSAGLGGGSTGSSGR